MFVAPTAYPLGGVQVWLDYVVEGLQEIGHQVTVGLVSGRFHDVSAYLSIHPFSHIQKIKNATGTAEGRIRSVAKAVRNVAPDVVISVNIVDVYPALERLSQHLPETRCVMTLHGIQADFLQDAKRYRHSLDGIICTNRLACELMRDIAAVDQERIHYAPYGVEVDPKPHANNLMIRPGERVRIAWVGRLEQEQKRVGDIAPILAALDRRRQPFEFWLVGGGPEEQTLRLKLEHWVAAGNVKFFGELPRERVRAEIYPNAHCLLLTSSWETGPIVVWEAMSAGVPVITSEYVGSREEGSLLDGTNCLMFPVGDAELAAQRICEFVSSDSNALLAKEGRKLVSSKYSLSASVRAWNEALEKTVRHEAVHGFQVDSSKESHGRLDRWFGIGIAERIRRAFHIRFVHRDAGGEWPHSHSSPAETADISNKMPVKLTE